MPLLGTATITGNGSTLTSGANTSDSIGNNFVTKIGAASVTADVSLITAATVQVTVPVSPQSGQAQGSPTQVPSTFTKFVDKASPLLWGALTTSQQLEILLTFFINDSKGNTQNFYTIDVKGAVLVSGLLFKPDVLATQNGAYGDMETFGFTYGQATWTHSIGGTQAVFTAAGSWS